MHKETPFSVFGDYLRELREESGYTLKSFAYQMDLTTDQYRQIESGGDRCTSYMTSLRSSIVPYLLHINSIKEKKEKFFNLYKLAVEHTWEMNPESKPLKRSEPFSEWFTNPVTGLETYVNVNSSSNPCTEISIQAELPIHRVDFIVNL
jgi:transcriptional regulator with XRE-family HTH domain